jgi:hypothetical protein
MARHRFVHGIVDDLGREVVQGDWHRYRRYTFLAAAHGSRPLQNLNVLGGIGLGAGGRGIEKIGIVLWP